MPVIAQQCIYSWWRYKLLTVLQDQQICVPIKKKKKLNLEMQTDAPLPAWDTVDAVQSKSHNNMRIDRLEKWVELCGTPIVQILPHRWWICSVI